MSNTVSLEIRGEQVLSSEEYGSLKLAQELPEQESLTVAEVAGIIDEMHGVEDSCANTREVGAYNPNNLQNAGGLGDYQQSYLGSKYSSSEDIEGLAEQFNVECRVNSGEPITETVYAFWSNREISENYKLICPTGKIGDSRRVSTRMRLKINVTSADYVDFGYFVKRHDLDPDFYEMFWVSGNVVDIYGRLKKGPSIKWDGEVRLYWEEPVSGSLFLEFDTEYDAYEITLPGVWTTGKRDYNATVWGIWEGSTPRLDLTVPDAASEENESCIDAINTTDISDLSDPNQIVEVVPPEDPPAPPEEEGDPEELEPCDCGEPCTAEGFESICCEPPPPGCVPSCLEFVEKNNGGHLPEGGIEGLKEKYGENVQIVFVDPPEGEDCGEHTVELKVKQRNCDPCGDVPPLQWAPDNPSIVAPGGSIQLEVLDGLYDPPDDMISWSVSGGTGWSFDGGGTSLDNGRVVTLYAAEDVCGTAQVSAQDNCDGNEGGSVEHTGVYITASSIDGLLPGAQGRVYAAGGTTPYTFTISGDGWTFDDGTTEKVSSSYVRVKLSVDACGDGIIRVTDGCSSDRKDLENLRVDVYINEASSIDGLVPGAQGRVYGAGGNTPYTYTLTGTGWTFDDGTTEKVTSGYVTVKLDKESCVDGNIEVADVCGSVDKALENYREDVRIDTSSSVSSLCPGAAGRVYLTASPEGIDPFCWSVSGGLELDPDPGCPTTARWVRVLNTGGGGSVIVSDACSQVTWNISEKPPSEC